MRRTRSSRRLQSRPGTDAPIHGVHAGPKPELQLLSLRLLRVRPESLVGPYLPPFATAGLCDSVDDKSLASGKQMIGRNFPAEETASRN